MNSIRHNLFGRGVGQEDRSWPMLVLLLAVVTAAIGCVLWFLGEAMRNERVAVRETLAGAYRGQLTLLAGRVVDGWNAKLTAMNGTDEPGERFARIVKGRLGISAICFDGSGGIGYPVEIVTGAGEDSHEDTVVLGRVRDLARAGDVKALTQYVIVNFPATDTRADGQGQLIAANAELLALEKIGNPKDADFRVIEERLMGRIGNYGIGSMPSAQRRFIMHEVGRLDPWQRFPMQDPEDLAARFLDAHATIVHGTTLRATEVPDVWSAESPDGHTLGLFTTVYVRGTLRGMIEDPSLAAGAWLTTEAPGEEPAGESIFTEVPVGAALPGWRLAVAIDSKTDFDSIAAPRVNTLIWVACTVIAGMTVLTIIIARSFGRQTRLARLKNDLVANVSHELKTPLTAMRALVETLIDSERLDEKTTREYLQMIATENMRLSRLIENFLTFSRLERDRYAFDFKVVRPEAVVDAAVVAFGERGHAPGCTLDLGVERDLPMIRGDVDALTTAVLNLMENAWKYSGDEKRIRVGASAHNGSVTFAVADNGIGLSARESRRVFGRFYQSDQRLARTAGGCGLGLSIVQSIVATHHGVVRVESELGKGSTFTIEIPTSGGSPL